MHFRNPLFAVALSCACLAAVCPEARAQADEHSPARADVRTLVGADERALAGAEIESLREQLKAREDVLLAPSKEDREAYAAFLSRADTGLVRLLPRGKWDDKLSMHGGGAYYSFERLTHEYGYGSDLELQQGNLLVGFAGADFGFMLNLGDVPLEVVSEETESVRFMASFRTPAAEPEARASYRLFGGREGHQAGPWTYRSRLPAVVGNTYALRSVNYGYSDLLVAFRVVRKDEDGSVVLLWKLLKKYPKPKLEQNVAAGQ
jgi:hypothetical protein